MPTSQRNVLRRWMAWEKKKKDTKLNLLRFQGDFYHNTKVLKHGGELVVWRRPGAGEIICHTDYVPCVHCLAFVTKKEMWRHLKTCENKANTNNNDIVAQCQLLLYPNKYSIGASQELITMVLDNMNKDDIYQCLSSDSLITTYGSYLLGVTAGFKKVNNISQRMRVLARLLLTIRKKTNNTALWLSDILRPEHFDTVIDATKELGRYNMQNDDGEIVPTFSIPSLPLLIGYALEKCASLMNGIGIKSKDQVCVTNAKDFLKLYKLEWNTKISAICIKNMNLKKFNKCQLLPITDDLLKVRSYMKENIPLFTKDLFKEPTLQNWRKLAELTGSRLTIFNRRRGNEAFNLLLKRFKERGNYMAAEMEEIKESLTPLEKRLMMR